MRRTIYGAIATVRRTIGARRAAGSCLLLPVAVTVGVLLPGPAVATGSAEARADAPVGHAIRVMTVPDSAAAEAGRPRDRPVDVHLWYPADSESFLRTPRTHYTSVLYLRRIGGPWSPLSWRLHAGLAREDAAIRRTGRALPVIVFSHGANNEPIDYAYTLERLAAEGFVVAAPAHVGNTQDDARTDFVNGLAGGPTPRWPCRDGGPPPCARASVRHNMRDRVADIASTLDHLPSWLGDRVDVSRAGVLGHSRGAVSALAAAGGSATWGIEPLNAGPPQAKPRLKALMILASAVAGITFEADIDNVSVPALVVAGGQDKLSPQWISERIFTLASGGEKGFVGMGGATHRSFDSTYCDQARIAGEIAQAHVDPGLPAPGTSAPLDWHTAQAIITTKGRGSGEATEYCAAPTFTQPVRDLVLALTGFEVDETGSNVPTTGLDSEQVEVGVTALAATFFGAVLTSAGTRGPDFTRQLTPEWFERHAPMVDAAVMCPRADGGRPPGEDATEGEAVVSCQPSSGEVR